MESEPRAGVAIGPADARSDQILQGILAMSSEAIITVDAHHRITTFSPGAEAIFGYTASEMVGAPLEQLLPEALRAAHFAHVEAFRTGAVTSRLMQDRGPIFGRRKTGEDFPIEASISKLDTGQGVVFTAIVRDVTERRRAEAQLARSERRLHLALRNSALHVFELDFRERALSTAGAVGALFDQPLTFDALEHDPWRALAVEDRRKAKAAWARHRRTGAPFHLDCRLHRLDGRALWVSLSAEMVAEADGQPVRLVGALHDITDRQRAKAALRDALAVAETANTAKSAFLATMSHEIRTPLNGILGMAQAMSIDALSPAQRGRLDVLQQSGETLLAILNDILDLSKIEAERLELESVEFDLETLIQGAQAAFSAVAEAKSLALKLDASAAAGRYLGDPTRLRQILYNLVSNALKFTEAGEVTVTADYVGDGLRIQVSDSGIGIAPSVLEALFEPFTQADTATSRQFGGTGLGLAISRRLAGLMNGSITVESAPGRGSTFVVALPLPRLGAATPQSVRPPANFASDRLAATRVLAAEDNPTNQLVLRALLNQIGVDPVIVEDGRQAIEAWETGLFDLILMDVQMPGMDGPSATHAIREREAARGLARTPIIALTANAMAHQTAEYLAAGMDSAVSKPISVAELFQALADAVQTTTLDHDRRSA